MFIMWTSYHGIERRRSHPSHHKHGKNLPSFMLQVSTMPSSSLQRAGEALLPAGRVQSLLYMQQGACESKGTLVFSGVNFFYRHLDFSSEPGVANEILENEPKSCLIVF